MNEAKLKLINKQRREHRVRSQLHGTSTVPRLSVHVSLMHVSAQLIDDDKHVTIAYSTTVGQKAAGNNLTIKAKWVGADIAKKAKAKQLKKAVYDRGSKLYHGRVAALADAAREAGLEI